MIKVHEFLREVAENIHSKKVFSYNQKSGHNVQLV